MQYRCNTNKCILVLIVEIQRIKGSASLILSISAMDNQAGLYSESITTLAKSADVTLTDVESVKRGEYSVPKTLLKDAFSMTHLVNSKPVYKQNLLSNSDIVIIISK
ncbi:MAG: hypothetical protein HFP77_06260 [Methylococcales symbiont of Iophon sp. n. MRB-2018]|nr:MAG: hypothetical protein HFP77_06260 [Methylococcales symbiont of Iophon sp. n. MRB-2018]KAF3978971.1 MAG: hypothetical protein HFP76_09585 [Methylococcales symbiont of Iophon sp. n. MRB-2018]